MPQMLVGRHSSYQILMPVPAAENHLLFAGISFADYSPVECWY
jgi:hypothetical protein